MANDVKTNDYQKKIQDLQKYVPFLENTIRQLKTATGKSREAQISKLQSLLAIFTNPNTKLKFEALKRCEEVILKLYDKQKSADTFHKFKCRTPPSEMREFTLSVARQKLNKHVELTPASPSPPPLDAEQKVHAPVVILTEKIKHNDQSDHSNLRNDVCNISTINQNQRQFSEDSWCNNFNDSPPTNYEKNWQKPIFGNRLPLKNTSQPMFTPSMNVEPTISRSLMENVTIVRHAVSSPHVKLCPLYQRRSDIMMSSKPQEPQNTVWSNPHLQQTNKLQSLNNRKLVNYAGPFVDNFNTDKNVQISCSPNYKATDYFPVKAPLKSLPTNHIETMKNNDVSAKMSSSNIKRPAHRELIKINFTKPVVSENDIKTNLSKPPLSESDFQDLLSSANNSPASEEQSPTTVDETLDLEQLEKLRQKLNKELEDLSEETKEKMKTKKTNTDTKIDNKPATPKPPKSPRVFERVVKESENIFGNLLSSIPIDEQIMEKTKEKKTNKKDNSKEEDSSKKEKKTDCKDKEKKENKDKDNRQSKLLNVKDIASLNEKVKSYYFKDDNKKDKDSKLKNNSEQSKHKDHAKNKDDSKHNNKSDSKHKESYSKRDHKSITKTKHDSKEENLEHKEKSKTSKDDSENKEHKSASKEKELKSKENVDSKETSKISLSKSSMSDSIKDNSILKMNDKKLKDKTSDELYSIADKHNTKEIIKIPPSGRLSDKYPPKRKSSTETLKSQTDTNMNTNRISVMKPKIPNVHPIKLADPRLRSNHNFTSPPQSSTSDHHSFNESFGNHTMQNNFRNDPQLMGIRPNIFPGESCNMNRSLSVESLFSGNSFSTNTPGNRTPADPFLSGNQTPADPFLSGNRNPADPFAASHFPNNFNNCYHRNPDRIWNRNHSNISDMHLQQNHFGDRRSNNFQNGPKIASNNFQCGSNIGPNFQDMPNILPNNFQDRSNKFSDRLTDFRNQSNRFQNFPSNQLNNPRYSNSNQNMPHGHNVHNQNLKNILRQSDSNKFSQYNLSQMKPIDFYDNTPDKQNSSNNLNEKRISVLFEIETDNGKKFNRPFSAAKGSNKGNFRGARGTNMYNWFANRRLSVEDSNEEFQNKKLDNINLKSQIDPSKTHSRFSIEDKKDDQKQSRSKISYEKTRKFVDENIEKNYAKEISSPLDSLYASEKKKQVGKGYGIQKFKIPKIKRNSVKDSKDEKKKEVSVTTEISQNKTGHNKTKVSIKVNAVQITDKEQTMNEISKKDDIITENERAKNEESATNDENEEVTQKLEATISANDEYNNEKKMLQEAFMKSVNKSEADQKWEMFNNFMKHTSEKCNRTVFLEFIETFGCSLPQSKTKRICRIIESDSEESDSENKKTEVSDKKLSSNEERTETEDVSKILTQKTEQVEEQSVENVVESVCERIKNNRRRKPLIYSSDSSPEKLAVTKLPEQIKAKREMFISEGVLTATGKRMCRLMNEHQESTKSEVISSVKKKELNTTDDEDDMPLIKLKTLITNSKNSIDEKSINKALRRTRALPRVILEKLEIPETTHSSDDESEIDLESTKLTPETKRPQRTRQSHNTEACNTKIECKTAAAAKKKSLPRKGKNNVITDNKIDKTPESDKEYVNDSISDNESVKSEELEVVISKKSLKNTRKVVRKRPKRKNWAMGVIRKKKLTRSQKALDKTVSSPSATGTEVSDQLSIPEIINDSDVEQAAENDCRTIDVASSDNEENSLLKIDLIPDINYYLNNKNKYDCRLCDYRGKFIVHHYKNKHPESENMISRLSPDEAETAKLESETNHFELINAYEEIIRGKKRRTNFSCRFCSLNFKQEFASIFFDHICKHTGEYRYRCEKCNFWTGIRKTLSAHCHTLHPEMKKPITISPIYPCSPNFRLLFGYICCACNFTQLLKINVEKHIKVSHPDQDVKIVKVSMSSKPVPLDDLKEKKKDQETVDGEAVDAEAVIDKAVIAKAVIVEAVDDETMIAKTVNFDQVSPRTQSENDDKKLDENLVDNSNTVVYSGTDDGLTGYDLYKCATPDCFFKASNIKDFKNHMYFCNILKTYGGWYICIHCDERFKFNELVDHIQIHGPKRFSCSLCNCKASLNHIIAKHMQIKHKSFNIKIVPIDPQKSDMNLDRFIAMPSKTKKRTKEQEFAATTTDLESASSSKYLRTEEETIFGPEDIDLLPRPPVYAQEIRCKLCLYNTKVRSNMQQHLQVHMDEETVPETAPVDPVPCLEKNEKMFDKMTNLIASLHTTGRMGGKYVDKSDKGLAKLEESTYPVFIPANKRYVCGAQDCIYLTHEDGMFRHHFTAVHFDEITYKCPHCQIELSNKLEGVSIDNILFHLKMHDLHLYTCNYCDFYHYQRHKTERHVSESHPDCLLTIQTIRELESSANLEDNRPPPSSKTTAESMDIQEAKPWHCGFCPYRSVNRSDIQNHAVCIHDIKSQYKCGLCHFQCSARNNYNSHFKTKHPNSEIDIISVYYKVVEESSSPLKNVVLEVDSEPEVFNTTGVRHIRGILLEEARGPKKSAPKIIEKLPEIKPNNTTADDKIENTEPTIKMKFPMIYGIPEKKNYVCPFCEKHKTKSVKEFISHLHSEMKYYRCACELCDFKSVDIQEAKDHWIQIHAEDGQKEKIKPVPVNGKIERWIEKCIQQQLIGMKKYEESENTNNNEINSSTETIVLDLGRSENENSFNLTATENNSNKQEPVNISLVNQDQNSEPESYKKVNTLTTESKTKTPLTRAPPKNRNHLKCKICKFNCFEQSKMYHHFTAKHQGQTVEYNLIPATKQPTFCQLKRKRQSSESTDETSPSKLQLMHHNFNSELTSPPVLEQQIDDISQMITESNIAADKVESEKIDLAINYICFHCPRRSKDLNIIRYHFIENHERIHKGLFKYKKLILDKNQKFPCKYCDWLGHPDGLKHHMKNHPDKQWVIEKNVKYRCTLCQKIFYKLDLFRKHFNASHPSENFTYQTTLDNDDTCIGTIEIIEEKIITQSEESKLIYCEYCPDTFEQSDQLLNHHQLLHSHLKLNASSSNSSSLNFEKKKFKCPQCGHTSNSYAAMQQHLRSHNKPYKCKRCSLSASYPSILKIHHYKEHRNFKFKYDSLPDAQKLNAELRENLLILQADGEYRTKLLSLKRPASQTKDEPPPKKIIYDLTNIVVPSTSSGVQIKQTNVAKKSTTQPSKVMRHYVAKKSTTPIVLNSNSKKAEEGFTYYGKKPCDINEYKHVMSEINIMGKSMPINVGALTLILNLFPTVLVEDIQKKSTT